MYKNSKVPKRVTRYCILIQILEAKDIILELEFMNIARVISLDTLFYLETIEKHV